MSQKPFLPLLIILVFCVCLLSVYALVDFEIKIESIPLKKSELSELFNNWAFNEKGAGAGTNNNKNTNLPLESRILLGNINAAEEVISFKDTAFKDTASIDSSQHRILLVGDSMGQSIYFALRNYCEASGHKLFLEAVESSTLIWWAKNDTLAKLIEKYDPTYIIISLGSNELFVPYIQKRKHYLDKIIAQIGDIPFVWIGPPNWKEDTGINTMLESTLGPGKFFLSKDLQMQRLKDGAHPTWKAAYYWVDTIASWIMHKSQYPILLQKKYSPKAKTVHANAVYSLVRAVVRDSASRNKK
ncbi:MAG: hypothetical protein RML72_02520 [Bacteroidia bacterium]|nr:hypothetical protein [Bacteroidia bacterium]